MSKLSFRYFKNFLLAKSDSKPLVAIPNQSIKSIQPFKEINRSDFLGRKRLHRNDELEHRLFDNMFEVVLSQDKEHKVRRTD